jgi:hypothetical protein
MAAPMAALGIAQVAQGALDSLLNFFKPAEDTVVVYDLPQSNKGINTVIFLALFVGVIFGLIYLFKR